MYGREELEPCQTHINCSFFKSYLSEEADKVMDAMEAKIKDLEGKLEDVQNTMADKNTDLGMENHKLKGRIHELEVKLNDKEQCCKWCGNDSRIAGLHKRIAELEAVISKMETTTPKWISVKDGLPQEGQHVLCVNNSRSLYPIDVICWREDYKTHSNITHWQPLPPPPTTEEIKND